MTTRPTAAATTATTRSYLLLAKRHYENFPVGSWLLPKAARRHLHRIYAFARTADDLADELADAPGLAAYRADFLAHLAGERADVPMFAALAETIRECALEVSLFTDLLDAFTQDLTVVRYDRAGLADYCRRSADPVGRLVLRVCGYRDATLDGWSDRICTALQLLNHAQDIGADLRDRGRIYVPRELLSEFSVAPEQLGAPRADAAVRALVLRWCDEIGAGFAAGWPLVTAVRGRLRWELRAILAGAAAVLRRIRAVDGDVLGARVHLTRGERLGSLFGGLCRRRAPVFVGAATGGTGS